MDVVSICTHCQNVKQMWRFLCHSHPFENASSIVTLNVSIEYLEV